MSAITDAANAVQSNFDKLTASLDNILAGIQNLDKLIVNFQNSPGTLSPADQKALDDIQAASGALVAKAAAIDTTAPVQNPVPPS